MPDEPTPDPDAPEPEPQDPPATDPTPTAPPDEPLGAGGKKALDEERRKAKEALKALKAAEEEIEKLRISQLDDHERAIAEARAEARSEAMQSVNERLIAAEIRAAAARKMNDPGDAVAFLADLDRSNLVDEDGAVDSVAIAEAIDRLVEAKPYLAATSATPAPQGIEQGPRGGGPKPLSLPDRIAEAEANGDRKAATRLKTELMLANRKD